MNLLIDSTPSKPNLRSTPQFFFIFSLHFQTLTLPSSQFPVSHIPNTNPINTPSPFFLAFSLLLKTLLQKVIFLLPFPPSLQFQALKYCGTAAMILAELSGNVAARFLADTNLGIKVTSSKSKVSMNWVTIRPLGPKRVRLITLFFTTIMLFLPALVSVTMFGLDGNGVFSGNLVWPLANAVLFGVLLSENYNDESLASSKDFRREYAVTFVCTLVLELFYFPELSLWGLLLCGLLLWIAVRDLDSVHLRYVELGLQSSESSMDLIKKPIRHILSERKSRKIAVFLLINTAYMVMEFVARFMSNSLGLISDARHMLFDCAALAIGLYASYIARLPANGQFNYGRGRFEVLSGYVNAMFLVLVGTLIIVESFERILDPQEISTNSLLTVSIGGLVVNVVGLIFFHEEHHHAHGGSRSLRVASILMIMHFTIRTILTIKIASVTLVLIGVIIMNTILATNILTIVQTVPNLGALSTTIMIIVTVNMAININLTITISIIMITMIIIMITNIDHNMEGIFLHVLADTMESVGVVVSTLLIKYKGWLVADPASIFISVLIVSSVFPLLRNSAEILLQRIPQAHELELKEAPSDVVKIKGVCGIRNLHIWSLHIWSFTNTDVVGTLHLHVSMETDRASVKAQASHILHDAGVKDLTLQVELVSGFLQLSWPLYSVEAKSMENENFEDVLFKLSEFASVHDPLPTLCGRGMHDNGVVLQLVSWPSGTRRFEPWHSPPGGPKRKIRAISYFCQQSMA
ncbi:Cation efflux protein [Dillenia turbinata]|uniref:Cation efflux protein n=1 Tax=Dillenia turbinata TaxID=194707 RepID=A0AAN8V4I5_9MAGN